MIDLKNLGSKNSSKKKYIESKFKIVSSIFIAMFIIGLIGSSVFFYVRYTKRHYVLKYVAVTGNKVLSINLIKRIANVDSMKSMYDFSEKKIYSNLIFNPWIRKAYVAKIYPDTIYIMVDEWTPKGVVIIHKKQFIVNGKGDIISQYRKNLDIDISVLPRIVVHNSNYMKGFLIGSIINIYEKLDKFGKINYIDVISDSYQLVHFANSLNVAVDSLNCPKEAFTHLKKEWDNLVSKRKKLDSVSICFVNKFVLRWKKER